MRRRVLLAGAALAASARAGLAQPASAPLPIPPSGRLSFRIMRHGDQIGEHNSTFEQKDDVLTIRADAEIVVRILAIPVFRFVHHVVERWQGGRFMSLETTTNDDGTPYRVNVERGPAGLVVTGSAQPRYMAPPEALPMTHWNHAELGVPKINPQKGDLLRPVVTDRGLTQIPTASGAKISARQYNFSGQAILDVWFDTNDRWAALAFLGSDQSQITLERR